MAYFGRLPSLPEIYANDGFQAIVTGPRMAVIGALGVGRLLRPLSDIAAASHLWQPVPMTYMTVFNVADHPFRNWWFPAFGLIFVAIGSGLVFMPAFFKFASPFGFQRSRMFRWFFFLFGCLWTISVAAIVITDTWSAINALDSGQFEVVEGRIENFKPMPWQGHSDETFDVNGVRFAYSDYQVSAGFNRSSSHGGPIKEGLPVRIAYKNGEILRLEVAR